MEQLNWTLTAVRKESQIPRVTQCGQFGTTLSALPLGVSPSESATAAVALVSPPGHLLLLGNVLLAFLQEVLLLLTLKCLDLDLILFDLELLSLLEAVIDLLGRISRRVLLAEPQFGLAFTLVEVNERDVLGLDLIAILEAVLDVLSLGVSVLESLQDQDGPGGQFQLLSSLLALGLLLFGLQHLLGLLVLLL